MKAGIEAGGRTMDIIVSPEGTIILIEVLGLTIIIVTSGSSKLIVGAGAIQRLMRSKGSYS